MLRTSNRLSIYRTEEVRMKVLVKEKIATSGIELLKKAGFQVDIGVEMSREEMLKKIGDYDGLIVRSTTQVDAEVIDKAKNLKVIGRAGVGVDNIDVEVATKKGIIVANAPQSNITSVAEHTIALLMAQCRLIPLADKAMKAGKWEKSKLEGVEVNNKILGVIGLGRIGNLVAARARGLGMKVIGYDPYLSGEKFQQLGVEMTKNLGELLKEADFISIHLPKTKETMGIIGKKEFALMKDGVRVFNTARGGIIDEAALVDAIKSGKVAGAGIDVFAKEPYQGGALAELPQVVLTPHIAASTLEAQDKAGEQIAEQVAAALKGDFVSNAVNVLAVPAEAMETLKPFFPLAEILGKLYSRLAEEQIGALDVEYCGAIAGDDTSLLTVAILKGIFESVVQEPVTFVNANILAKERGMEIKETRTTVSREYVNLITVKSAQDKLAIAGTLLGKANQPRIVRLYDYEIDLVPSKYMLIVHNKDKPGMIGKIGMTMGNRNINIASMQFGRKKARGDAVSVLSVDEHISETVLNELKAIDGVLKAKFVEL